MAKLITGLGGTGLSLGLALALGACATAPPPPELLDARQAYTRAKGGEAAQLAPAQLYDAQKTLTQAEAAFEDDASAQTTRDLAYVASRKAVYAETYGAIAKANRDREQAQAQLAQLEQERTRSLQSALGQAQQQLGMTQQQLDAAQRARAEADKRAQDAMAKLEGMASMKQESRGTVITLTGNLLFASGKAELLGTAQSKLRELTAAIKDDPRKMSVIGHTDSQGDDAYNMTLSQKRAEAVRTFLISTGVSSDQVAAVGMGETQPIADNASPEGRANNRRVEIVLEGPSPGSPSTTR